MAVAVTLPLCHLAHISEMQEYLNVTLNFLCFQEKYLLIQETRMKTFKISLFNVFLCLSC
jgi:hypothetical protein